jgi:hypothetical protein
MILPVGLCTASLAGLMAPPDATEFAVDADADDGFDVELLDGCE